MKWPFLVVTLSATRGGLGLVAPRAARVRTSRAAMMTLEALRPTPGTLEDDLFEQDESIQFWRDWNALYDQPSTSGLPQANGLLDVLASKVQTSFANEPVRTSAYWTYHLGRSGFFATQWVLAYATFMARRQAATETSASRGPDVTQTAARMPRLLAESLSVFAQDYASIESGSYGLPYDMTEVRHRQYSPAFLARQSARFAVEAAANLARRGKPPVPLWLDAEASNLPDYYRTFHFQTDGYMSSKSAAVYEVSTESLFLGRQDAMQRTTLVPLMRFAAEPANAAAGPLRLLELGCGTGRFLTFALDALQSHPGGVRATAVELSPFYLEAARRNVDYAARLRGWPAETAAVRFVLGSAESMPELADGSQDAIMCVYTFHELPPTARVAIAREVGRLLRPGGVFVLTDSLQLGDRPSIDAEIPVFSQLNEPYYQSFLETDFADLLRTEAGMRPEWKGLRSATKTLSFRKPE